MQVFLWIFRLAIFLCFLMFAIKNSSIVSVDFFFQTIEAPLVLVLFASFGGGILFGLLILLGSFFSLRKEMSSLKREVKDLKSKESLLPKPDLTLTHDHL